MKKKNNLLILFVLIAAVLVVVFSFLNLKDNVVYFFTPLEAQEKFHSLQNQTVRIGAMVKPESVTWDSKNIMLNFTMTDMNEHEIQVSYKGSPPDLFKEGQGVVAEGTLENEGKSLKATRLMVKHSEEYKAPKDAHNSVNKELLEKSLFK